MSLEKKINLNRANQGQTRNGGHSGGVFRWWGRYLAQRNGEERVRIPVRASGKAGFFLPSNEWKMSLTKEWKGLDGWMLVNFAVGHEEV